MVASSGDQIPAQIIRPWASDMKIMRKEIDQSPSFTRLRAVKSYDNHHHEFNSCTAHCNDDPNQFSGTSSTMAVRNTHLQLVGMVRVPRIETPPHASLLITKAGDARARFYCPIHSSSSLSSSFSPQPPPALSVDTGQALILFARPAGSAGLV